jgi:cytochrome c-type biogenesis protein CcmH
MMSDAGTFVMVGALTVAIALALASALSWQRARAGRRRRLSADIEASRSLADDIRRRHLAGELTQEEFDRQQSGAVAHLLEQATPGEAPRGQSALPSRTRALAACALLVALAAGGVHAWLSRQAGAEEGTRPLQAQAAPPSQSSHGAHLLTDDQLEHMVAQSRQRVLAAPQDAAAWAMLAHSYDMLGKFAESSKAYATLAGLVPKDAQVLADYADALAVANGRTLAGEPTVLVNKALEIDPRNVKALTLAGSAAFERQDFAEAIARWQAARDLIRDPRFANEVDASLATARAAAKGSALPAPALANARTPTAAGAVVSGRITLADDLQSKAPPDATVFVFARPVDGSRMPVAILRRHVRDLPLQFSLDDSMSMVPDARLSKVSSVVVGARISRRGDVAPVAGDMQGLSAPVSVGTRGIKLEISEVLQ